MSIPSLYSPLLPLIASAMECKTLIAPVVELVGNGPEATLNGAPFYSL